MPTTDASERETRSVLVEIAVEPAVSGDQHRQLIAEALTALSDPALTIKVGALSTTVEGPLDDALHAVQRAHLAAATGDNRVVTSVRIESREGLVDLESRLAEAEELQARAVEGLTAPGDPAHGNSPPRGDG